MSMRVKSMIVMSVIDKSMTNKSIAVNGGDCDIYDAPLESVSCEYQFPYISSHIIWHTVVMS